MRRHGYMGPVQRDALDSLLRQPGQSAAELADDTGRPLPSIVRALRLARSHGWVASSGAGRPRQVQGDAASAARLTAGQVREMRGLRRWGGLTYRQLGERYGVCKSTARRACSGEHWGQLASDPLAQPEAPGPQPFRWVVTKAGRAALELRERAGYAPGVSGGRVEHLETTAERERRRVKRRRRAGRTNTSTTKETR